MKILFLIFSLALPLLVVFGIIMFVVHLVNNKKTYKETKHSTLWPYGSRTVALSSGEMALFKGLRQNLPESVIICPKMNLKDILYVKEQRGNSFKYYYKRLVYHTADFMLLSAIDFKPVCGIVSENSKDEKRHSEIQDMSQVFNAAGIPLVLIESKSSYSAADIERQFGDLFSFEKVKEGCETTREKEILCPKCGAAMLKRTAKQGDNQGKSFYGCSKYPACKGIVSLT